MVRLAHVQDDTTILQCRACSPTQLHTLPNTLLVIVIPMQDEWPEYRERWPLSPLTGFHRIIV